MTRRIIQVALVLACLTLTLSLSLDGYLSKSALAEKGEGAGIQELPLGIQKIHLKGNKVYITIVRTGGGKIDPGDYSKIKMKVDPGSGKPLRQWSLTDVDRNKALSAAGGKIEFDTGIVLEKGETVKAILSFGKWETSKQEALSLMTATALDKTAPSKMMAQGKLPADSAQPNMMKAKAIIVEHGLNRPEAVPRILDGGIRISSPEGGRVTSSVFTLRYSIDCRKADGDITFVLVNRGDIVSEATHHFTYTSPRPSEALYVQRNFSWAISPDLPDSDRYGIIAAKSDASGISDPFSISLRRTATVPIGQGLNVDLNSTRSAFRLGETLRMTFTVNRVDSFDNLELWLEPYRTEGSGSDSRTPMVFPINTGGAATLVNYNWTISATIPIGKYRLHAKAQNVSYPAANCEWYSQVIEILPVPPAVSEGAGITLRVDNPRAGTTIYLRSIDTVYVTWYCNVGRDSRDERGLAWPGEYVFTRVLLKGGVEYQRIGPISYYGRTFSDMIHVLGYENGSDYEVRVELYRPGDGDSWVLVKSETSGYFTITY